ncbi:Na+/melibiose symporter-like transporter [Sphingobium herbicidovorans NBRC 16415]|uniref:Na+/melibiose symporter-like transporter n=1 Tax=Sphingobium herbicidovorans (strain ATCC 700291 / DSM 11019 / CCUG 56400 / KCTC 2939 / LMG 18315 / NBRC 16415 / MH) TaxID=1219045 RepID=A0A086P4N3_SPHHM|nr:MFS transporter [Sphingobium herbicidovorans]KFG88351.1 Na+/melibiose symporter-like transporter [Sphingobium herbicidovorans NBRC 16415]
MTVPSRVSGPRLAAFSVTSIATGGFNIPLQTYLPAFYATAIGMDLATVGLVFMISRLWSAAADPLVGWASDHSRTRIGRRKPWILGGGLLFLLSLYAVFSPPAGASPLYLGGWLLLLCLGWTATSTPLYAWGGEMASSPIERARIQAYIQTGSSIGIFLVLVLPALLDATGRGNPEIRVGSMGALVAVVLAAGILLIAILFREPPVADRPSASVNWRQGLIAMLRDASLWRIVASDFFVALGQGFRTAIFLFFVTRYMGMASPALLLMLQYAFGIFAAPLWARISYRFGRLRTLVMAEAVQVVINLMVLFLTPDRMWLFIVLIVGQGLTQGSGNLMLRSMIYDVADRHRETSGVERAGLFSSVFNVTTNAAYALAVGIALPVVGLLGFDPRSSGTDGLAGMHLFFAIGPAFGHFMSILVISWQGGSGGGSTIADRLSAWARP